MANEKAIWELRGRQWLSPDLHIGFSAPLHDVDIEAKPAHDVLTLYQSDFECETAYSSDKLRKAAFERGDITFTETDAELKTRAAHFGEIIYISSPTGLQKRMLADLAPNESLSDFSTSGVQLPRQREISRMLLQFLDSNGFGGRMKAEALTCLVLTELLVTRQPRDDKQNLGGLGRAKTNRAIEFINANLDEDISLERIALTVEISPFHFSRMFKQETGMSPYQYVIHSRVELARGLLLTGRDSIADIAIQVGFSSQSHLTESFKKIVGTTPAKFRRMAAH
ncbi:AraC family transcriptional regulator [Yoonia sp. SS1-5]|uniref:Helix-turn-helix domain-containing protein n=1 Tax=Yoonia rhodophyticola TaxID=3137370 RepID=A0AAN0NGZ6_9RHOB